MFDGQNILPSCPENLKRVVQFLKDKQAQGEFVFSDSPEYWAEHEDLVDSLDLGIDSDGSYFAVSMAYLASLNNGKVFFSEKSNVWRWAWSLNLLAAFAEWPAEYMKNAIESCLGHNDEIDDLMNNVTHTYSYTDFNNGLSLISLLPEYAVSIKAGLMENDFEQYSKIYPPEDNVEGFANAFAIAFRLKTEDVNKAVDRAATFPSFDSPSAMGFFLAALTKVDGERKSLCKEHIRQMLTGDTMQYVNVMAKWAFMFRETDPFLEECILLLVKGLGKENGNLLKPIDNAVSLHHDETQFLIKLVACVAENMAPMEVLKLEKCLHSLSSKKEEFLNLVLSFILHPKGLYRVAGRRLWDTYHMENSDFDASELEEILQCVFILSMLQDLGNPETRLPKVLPLLEKGTNKAKAFLMGHLRHYLDDYMGHVINVLDELKIENEESIIIRKYFEGRANAVSERRAMKELMPVYTYNREFREAMRLQNEHMEEMMKEAEKDYSPAWQEFLATVVLARGGGWRDKKGKTQHLSLISYSVPSHQMVQSLSPKEQDDWSKELIKDWDDTERSY